MGKTKKSKKNQKNLDIMAMVIHSNTACLIIYMTIDIISACRHRYHRNNADCIECLHVSACINSRPADCYGQYKSSNPACIVCTIVKECRASTYCYKRFSASRRGEPHIVLSDAIYSASAPEPSEPDNMADFARAVMAAADHDPLNVAIIVARAANCSINAIGQYLGMSKQAILYRIASLSNRHVSDYLRYIHASKHDHNVIKSQILGSFPDKNNSSGLGRVGETEDSQTEKFRGKAGVEKGQRSKSKSIAFNGRKQKGQSGGQSG